MKMTGTELPFFSTEAETSETLHALRKEYDFRCVGLANFPFELAPLRGSKTITEFLCELPLVGLQKFLYLHSEEFDLDFSDQIDFHRVNKSVISIRLGKSGPNQIFQSSVSYRLLNSADQYLFSLLSQTIRNFGEFGGRWVSPLGGSLPKNEIISPRALRSFRNGCFLHQAIGRATFTPN